MQCFASQRMVEVHNDNIFFYFQDRTVHAVAVRIHHRYRVAFFDHFRVELAVYLENILRKIQYVFLHIFAVCISRSYGKIKFVAYFQSFQSVFKSGEHSACTKDEFQRCFSCCSFHQFAFFAFAYIQIVSNCNELICCDKFTYNFRLVCPISG